MPQQHLEIETEKKIIIASENMKWNTYEYIHQNVYISWKLQNVAERN